MLTTAPVVAGLLHDGGVFHRTPKYRIETAGDAWKGNQYGLQRDVTFYVETLFAIYFVVCFALAVHLKMWLSIPFLYLFLHGYVHMFLLGVGPLFRRPGLRSTST